MSTPIKILETAQLSTMQVSLRDDGLLQVIISPGTHTSLELAKDCVEAMGKVGGGLAYPVLVIAGKETTVSTDAMEFLSKPASDPYAKASAYLIFSISQKLLGNFYLNFNKPVKPTRMFTSEELAVEWLYSFR